MTMKYAVPVAQFGKDHWSVFAYIETRCVDYKGVPAREHMRCSLRRHPGLVAKMPFSGEPLDGAKFPTILARGKQMTEHDDWDCADDLEAAGFLEQVGTGINPVFCLTPLGQRVASALRAHKATGGQFAAFKWAG